MLLEYLLQRFRDELVLRGDAAVRLNIMDIEGRMWNKHLGIAVYTDGYTQAEIGLEWKKGTGACGLAWRENRQMFSNHPDDHIWRDMSAQHKVVCQQVTSVVSTPIAKSNGRIVAVLNMDTTQMNNPLGTEDNFDVMAAYADIIAKVY